MEEYVGGKGADLRARTGNAIHPHQLDICSVQFTSLELCALLGPRTQHVYNVILMTSAMNVRCRRRRRLTTRRFMTDMSAA